MRIGRMLTVEIEGEVNVRLGGNSASTLERQHAQRARAIQVWAIAGRPLDLVAEGQRPAPVYGDCIW